MELEFTDDALEAVAEQALLRGTGARGLRAILEEVLLNVMYDLPGRSDIGRCVIDGDTVLRKVNPTLVPAREHAVAAAPPGRVLTPRGATRRVDYPAALGLPRRAHQPREMLGGRRVDAPIARSDAPGSWTPWATRSGPTR